MSQFNENGVEHTTAEAALARDKCNELILACDEFIRVAAKYNIILPEVDKLKEVMQKDVEKLNEDFEKFSK